MENTYTIKGSCENCGFAYKGTIPSIEGSFAEIKCPKCGKHTQNFDEASAIDDLEKAEGYKLDYQESQFEVIKQI